MAIRRRFYLKIINSLRPFKFNKLKIFLFNKIPGCSAGKNSVLVGPIYITGCNVSIGENTFVGRNFETNGNGQVNIGNNVDIAPNVVFLTGSHIISSDGIRRAGKGFNSCISIGTGTWIGANSTILACQNGTHIGDFSIIGCCSNVISDVDNNCLVCGNPAKLVRKL